MRHCPFKQTGWDSSGASDLMMFFFFFSHQLIYINIYIYTWNPFVLCFYSKRRPFPVKTRVIWVAGIYRKPFLAVFEDSPRRQLWKIRSEGYVQRVHQKSCQIALNKKHPGNKMILIISLCIDDAFEWKKHAYSRAIIFFYSSFFCLKKNLDLPSRVDKMFLFEASDFSFGDSEKPSLNKIQPDPFHLVAVRGAEFRPVTRRGSKRCSSWHANRAASTFVEKNQGRQLARNALGYFSRNWLVRNLRKRKSINFEYFATTGWAEYGWNTESWQLWVMSPDY